MRLFGTDGIRGEVGKYPLTAENILKLAKAASLVLKKNNSSWHTYLAWRLTMIMKVVPLG